MLKKTVNYIDYNDEPATETLYFNLNKTEASEMDDLLPALQDMQARLKNSSTFTEADQRTMMRDILQLLKALIEKAYGERSDDGKRFIKSPEIYRDFTQTAVYDSFLFSMFENDGAGAVEFITSILPKDIREQALKEVNDSQPSLYEQALKEAGLPEEVNDDRPAWIKEDRDPTQAELRTMTPEQMQEAFARRLSK